MNVVRVRVTGSIAGVAIVFPYEHTILALELPLYRVPLYEVRVNERNVFRAVRFGFRGHFEHPWDPHRVCDEGIVVQSEVAAEWNAIYAPHSRDQGNGRAGGFRIRNDQVYIHEGPSFGSAIATLSCIEIASQHDADDWNRFLDTVSREAGVSQPGPAVKSKKVLVTVEQAVAPKGLLIGRIYRSSVNEVFSKHQLMHDWSTTTTPWVG